MSSILVIGCVSLDTIHLEQSASAKTYSTVGGAGLFTALAAAHGGAAVTLYAPKPDPMPVALKAIDKIVNWIGPRVSPDQMPTLEIVHHGQGLATLIGASWGPERLLIPEDLYNAISLSGNRMDAYNIVHIAALSSAKRQLEFLQFFTRSTAPSLISGGTYARAISANRKSVRQLLKECHIFFMNSNEAALLFEGDTIVPKNSQLIFVTAGKEGATIYSTSFAMESRLESITQLAESIKASPADELDPTGAGDTFCGATLAALSQGGDAITAARLGSALAARIIEHPGSSFYF